MKHIILTLSLLLVISAGCKKKLVIEAPACIKAKIAQIVYAQDSYVGQVDEYIFKNKKVYAFKDSGIADGQTPIYDENCNQVCALGGLLGTMMCDGENFNNAVFVRTVWKR